MLQLVYIVDIASQDMYYAYQLKFFSDCIQNLFFQSEISPGYLDYDRRMASDHKFDISLRNMEKTFPHQKETFYTHQDMDVFLLIIFTLVSYRTAEPILLNCNTDEFSFITFFLYSLLTTVLSLSPVTASCTEIYCVTNTVKSTYVPDSFHLTDILHVH